MRVLFWYCDRFAWDPTIQTPFGHFNDLSIAAQGHPVARIYKEFCAHAAGFRSRLVPQEMCRGRIRTRYEKRS